MIASRRIKPHLSNTQITEVFFKNITQSLPQYVYWKDAQSVYLGCNQHFAELVGLRSPEEIIGKTDHDLPWQPAGHTADFFQKGDQETMQGHPVANQEEWLLLPDGKKLITRVSKLPIFDANQRILGVVGYFTDITDLKEKECALQEAIGLAEAANRAKSLFIANMSHDLRTPLSGLIGMAELLANEVSSAKGKQSIQQLLQAGRILLTLLNEVIEFTQSADAPLPVAEVKFSLKNLLEETVQLIRPSAEEKQLRLTVQYDDHIPSVLRGDFRRLRRILLNLVSNAVKFTHQGGVEVTASLAEIEDQRLVIELAVADTGIGIPPEQQAFIFSRFSRLHPAYEAHYSGAGLGLALTKQLITELNGEIDVVSSPGSGSTFSCLIPLRKSLSTSLNKNTIRPKLDNSVSATPNQSMPVHAEPSTKCAILLVEDNAIVQIAVRHQLTLLGCHVDSADNGAQALKQSQRNRYDLIFMDIGLPDMSGCEVTQSIRQDSHHPNYDTPIIALTAHADGDQQKVCLAAGMQRVLIKPLQPDQAREVLATWAKQKTK